MGTSLTRWHPFADIAELRSRLDRVFDEMSNGDRTWSPSVDVIKKEDRLVIRADVPGVKPDDIEVEVSSGVLTISGEHEEKTEEKEERYVRRERRYGSFSRSMTLPEGVDPKDIEATSKDGVLELTIPVPEPEKDEAVRIKPKAAS